MAGRRLTFHSPSTPLGRDPQITASPQTDDRRLLIAISGLSRQINLNTADIKERLDSVDSRLLSLEEKLVALELNSAGETNSDKRRRVRNPKLAESVRRLHNSETNSRRYEPEQGLISPRNEAEPSKCQAGKRIAGGRREEFSSELSKKKEAAGIETGCARS
uniref:Uncharacterized protein n=2 Tax=Knipowitschia caucasica TaxID=637954 RepID=A0AAV2JD59_KNICA